MDKSRHRCKHLVLAIRLHPWPVAVQRWNLARCCRRLQGWFLGLCRSMILSVGVWEVVWLDWMLVEVWERLALEALGWVLEEGHQSLEEEMVEEGRSSWNTRMNSCSCACSCRLWWSSCLIWNPPVHMGDI